MSLMSGVDDFLGSVLNSNVGQSVLEIYKQKTAAEIAADAAKAQAEADAARAKAAAAAAKAAGSSTASGGGIPPSYILIGVAGALGLGVIVWAATRR